MFFIFGTRGRTTSGDTIDGPECPSCGGSEFRTFGTQRYFHLYWIPTLPLGRTAGLECTHCRHTLVGDEVPEDLRARVAASAFAGRSRLPLFAGSVLIAALIAYASVAGGGSRARSEAVLDAPAVGDFYVVDYTKLGDEADGEHPYGIWRLSEMTEDSLHFEESRFVYEYWSDATSDIRKGVAEEELDLAGDGVYVDADQMATWRTAGAFPRVLRP